MRMGRFADGEGGYSTPKIKILENSVLTREILQTPNKLEKPYPNSYLWSCARVSLGLSMGMGWPEKHHR